MSLPLTLGLIAAAALLAWYAGWKGAKPADPLNPRLVPWRFVMLLCCALIFLLVIHLAALVGFTRPR